MSIAGVRRGFLQSVRGKFRIDIAGVAVGEDVEARGFGKSERDAGVGVADVDVGLRRGREAEFDVAIAVVDFYLAGGIFDGYGIAVGAQRDVSRRVDDFEIAGAGFHVAGERGEREIGALRDEAETFGDFFSADGAVEFAVESEAAGGGRDVNFRAFAGNLDVTFGVGDFDVAFVHFDVDVAGGVADFDVAVRAGDGDGRGHVGNSDVSLFVSDGDRGLLGDLDVHVDGDARVAGAGAGGMNFIAVAILNDFDGDGAGAA